MKSSFHLLSKGWDPTGFPVESPTLFKLQWCVDSGVGVALLCTKWVSEGRPLKGEGA